MPDIPMSTIWLILFIIFIIAEIATAGQLVSIWFCFGSIAAMFAAMAGASFIWQMVIFIAVSIILLILTKPFVRKLHSKIQVTNAGAIIGEQGVVIEKINNIEGAGAIKIQGKIWSARSSDENLIINEGSKVKILDIQGVKAIVEKIGEE